MATPTIMPRKKTPALVGKRIRCRNQHQRWAHMVERNNHHLVLHSAVKNHNNKAMEIPWEVVDLVAASEHNLEDSVHKQGPLT